MNDVDRTTIKEVQRRWRLGGRGKGTLLHRLVLRDVECGMDSHGMRELQDSPTATLEMGKGPTQQGASCQDSTLKASPMWRAKPSGLGSKQVLGISGSQLLS